jgi:tetratricopeptide (TPR) repeat protein
MLRDALSAISSGDRTGRLAHLAVLNELGRCSFALCEWADAHEYFARGLDLARREGDRRLEGVLSVNLGNVLSELHESESCLEHYREALQIHRLHADADGQSLALHDPAVVHARIGDGAESIRCAREAMRLVQSSGRWTLDAGRNTRPDSCSPSSCSSAANSPKRGTSRRRLSPKPATRAAPRPRPMLSPRSPRWSGTPGRPNERSGC